MSHKEKLIEKLQSRPKDFTWGDLLALLRHFDYEEVHTGKTSGSEVKFQHPKSQSHNPALILHKPHPAHELKPYQVEHILKHLKDEGRL